MDYRVNLLWKITAELSPEGVVAARSANGLLFNRRGGKSFLKSVGGNFRTNYCPVVLQPTDMFHEALCELQKELDIKGTRFPVELYLDLIGQRTRLNISLHLYGTFVCATCRLDEFAISADSDLARLQKLPTHKALYKFISSVLAITVSGDRSVVSLSKIPKIYPVICLEAVTEDSPTWEAELVGLVTRHSDATRIVNEVIKKNFLHQIDQTLLLVDKQGIAGYVPIGCSDSTVNAHRQRFLSAAAMTEYAAMLRLQLSCQQWLPEDARETISNPDDAVPNSVSARHIWNLIVKEFSLQTELRLWSKSATKPAARRILLVTVTDIESKAVHEVFSRSTGTTARPIEIDGFRYQNLGNLGSYEVIHAISGMGTSGLAGSQESVRRSISSILPIAVVMVGIAFGIDKVKQKIAEVLVSRQVFPYELQRIGKSLHILPRGDKVTASPMLLDWVAHAQLTWDKTRPKVRTGLLLSGEKLVDNLLFRKKLCMLAPEAIGGEMEAAGVYVACQTAKVEWLVIKSICDWADGRKHENKESNQAQAAASAAEFAFHVLNAT